MSQAKIVIFSALYMPHLGGVEKFSQSIAAELSKTDQVTVFCMNTENLSPEIIREGNVEVHFLPCFSLQKGRFPVPKLSAVRLVRDWFRDNQVDFGIVQCRFYLLSLLGCEILHRHQIPFIQIEHGAGDVMMPNPVVDRVWHLYDRLLTEREKKIPHDFYAVSHAGLKWLEHYGIHGVGVISNSVAPQDFTEGLRHPGTWKREHEIPENSLLITFSGRIMREKGVTDLLDAFDRLRGDKLYLVIAGEGERKLVRSWEGRENILFPGQIPFSEIPYLLADTAIYCLPSHFIEGKPTGVLEAGMCGNAVVVTASGGSLEIVPDNDHGRLVPAGDIDALTEAIQGLVDDPDERKRIGENLHARVMQRFTWQTAADAVRAAMDRCGL
ncbi:MAG: glycosyltransferase family 4 protein [Flexilinea sp.]|nr:glycosyltransferase family 4 protein [Flexilinea sp.]